MRIGKVLGSVTVSQRHESMLGASFRLVRPLTWDELTGRGEKRHEEIVVMDEIGSHEGQLVALSEGREAAMPFYPDVKPVCGYVAAILDSLELDDQLIQELEEADETKNEQ